MMKRSVLFLFSALLISAAAIAQTHDGKLWTLKECVDYALSNSLDVRRSELNVRSNEVTYTQYKMNLLPSVNGNASYGYNWGRGLDPVSNQFVSSQRNSVSSLNASTSLNLFSGYRVQNLIKQGSRDVAASEQDLLKMKNDVSLLITDLFVTVVFNKELVEFAKYQLASSQQQLERVKKQVAAGSLAKAEELNLQAQVATNELNLLNQTNALNLSLLQLKQAMQIPAQQEFDVSIPQIEPEDLLLDLSREEVFNLAKGTLPEIQSSKLKVESSLYAVKAARGGLTPRLSLNGSLNTNYSKGAEAQFVPEGVADRQVGYTVVSSTIYPVFQPVPTGSVQNIYGFGDQIKDNLYKSVGLTLTLPIFNNFQSRAAVQRSIITNEQAKISEREIENTLRKNIETAYNDALAASTSYQSSTRQVQARDEAFRMTKQRYEVGAVNYVDYQVAENNLFQAQSDLARAKYNFIFKKKLLDFYQGKPLEY